MKRRTTLVKKDREPKMGRKMDEAQTPGAELQAQPSASQGPKGRRRWAHLIQVTSEESKRTGKMLEYWRLADSIPIFKRGENRFR